MEHKRDDMDGTGEGEAFLWNLVAWIIPKDALS